MVELVERGHDLDRLLQMDLDSFASIHHSSTLIHAQNTLETFYLVATAQHGTTKQHKKWAEPYRKTLGMPRVQGSSEEKSQMSAFLTKIGTGK